MESLRAAILQWAETDPQASLAWVQNFTKDFEQWQLTNAILGAWTQREPIAAATYALGLPLEKRQGWESLRQVVMFWSRNDPRATLAWVQKLTPGLEQSDLLNLTVSGWAPRDPEAAVAFAVGYPPGRDRIFFLQSAFEGWLGKNPAAAWAFAQSLPEETFPAGMPKLAMMDNLLEKWGGRDPASALSHVNELSDPAKRRAKQDWLVMLLAEKDRTAALGYAHKLTGIERDSALYAVAKQQSDRDPKFAATVAAEISPSEYQKYAGEMLAGGLGNVAISTAAKDPAEAIKLLAQIPKGRQRSNAVLFVALAVARRDPETAMALADTYPEAEESEGVRANVFRGWLKSDRAAALAWLEKKNLPAEIKRQMLGLEK